MDELPKEYIVSFFDRNLQLCGDRPEAVRWSATGQRLHYQSLLDIGRFDNAKILDFGCGKGDFFQFLRDRGIPVDYTGYDINEKLIALARSKYPAARFRVFDLDRDVLEEYFDFIFLCGVFNLKVSGIEEAMRKTLIHLFRFCRKAMACNALSGLNPKKDFELFYVSPEELFRFAVMHLSPYVALRHERMAYDFTLFVYKDIVAQEKS